ncbi:hypothetical protein TrVFT333_006134 [Trichoderma virens FT-333]|nr:hypothetical protein TrVFT333_006134 [Trichoderma virens FT-333]
MPVAEADAEAAAAAAATAAVAVAAAPVEASTHSPGNDDTIRLASPLSTPTTATSPVSPTFLSVAGRVSTPLSLFVDSAPSSGKKKSSTSPGSESAAAVRQRYLAMSPTASAIAPGAASADTRESKLAEAGKTEAEAEAEADTATEGMRRWALREQEQQQEQEQEEQDEAGWREKNLSTSAGSGSGPPLPWSPSSTTSNSNIIAAAALSPTAGDIKHDASRGVISAPLPQGPNRHERPSITARDSDIATITGANSSSTTGIATVASGSNPGSRTATVRIPAAPEEAPLHTGSVQPGTKLAHPKPILHIATDISSPSKHSHHSDLLTRSASAVSNVAHLEATAERLSMTSSIDDAIRELHCELKRSDSRRSSILAARAASADEHSTRLRRYPSNSSSSAAAAARQRGYSPAYVMSPTNSLTGRMRSGSNASAGRPEHDAINSILSRHGPGKSSVRSVRSAKPSLAEISESEPISLTQHVLDQVDAVPPFEHAAAASSRSIIEQDAVGVPQIDEFHDMLEGGFRSHRASNLVLVNPDLPSDYEEHEDYEAERPMTANSTNTFQVAQDAFVDFDGAHCETDNEDDRFATADMGSRSQKRDRLSDMHQHQQPTQLPPPSQMMPPSQVQPPVDEDDLMPTPNSPRPSS